MSSVEQEKRWATVSYRAAHGKLPTAEAGNCSQLLLLLLAVVNHQQNTHSQAQSSLQQWASSPGVCLNGDAWECMHAHVSGGHW
jgi:outer membrane PBP1 activator LpoA protein